MTMQNSPLQVDASAQVNQEDESLGLQRPLRIEAGRIQALAEGLGGPELGPQSDGIVHNLECWPLQGTE